MKKTLSISVLACALALTFAVPALAHGRQACNRIPSTRKPICVERTAPILMRMETASVITVRTVRKTVRLIHPPKTMTSLTARTESRAPAADTAEDIIPAAVMEDTADAETG